MPFLLLLSALLFAASPLLTPGFGGFDPDRFPVPQIDPAVQPATYAFGIWGLIYAWLVIGMIFQAWKRRDDPAWAPIRLPMLISLGIGAIWLPVAQASPIWATILIWAMWVPAILALLRAPIGDVWAGRAPVGLYAGWLTAAACVSLGLMAAGEVDHPAVKRGIDYLMQAPRDGGKWDETFFNAVGFPRVFYLRYHGYSAYFPLWALARYRNLTQGNAKTTMFGI